MDKDFAFLQKNDGACVTGILSPGAVCAIPETLGGLPVTELSDRLFSGSAVEEVYLPRTLRRIGRYAFYNCERLLRLHFYSGIREVGGGVFNASGGLKELFLYMEDREGQSPLRDFVTELSGRVTVHYFVPGQDGETREAARLVYPVYYDEAVENTPARITVSNIHGSGQRYRYCFVDRKVRFDRYDKVFVYERAEESVAQAAEIALYRLRWPLSLWDEAREEYERFLMEHLFEILCGLLGDAEMFRWAWECAEEICKESGESAQSRMGVSRKQSLPLTAEELDRLTSMAAEKKTPELAGFLMEKKRRLFGAKKKTFEF